MMLMPATFSMLMVSSGPGDRTRAPPKPSGTCMRDFGAFAHFSGLVPSEPLLLGRLGQKDTFKIQASIDASGEARATTGEIFDMSSVAHERDDKPSSAGRAREEVAPAACCKHVEKLTQGLGGYCDRLGRGDAPDEGSSVERDFGSALPELTRRARPGSQGGVDVVPKPTNVHV